MARAAAGSLSPAAAVTVRERLINARVLTPAPDPPRPRRNISYDKRRKHARVRMGNGRGQAGN